MLYFLSNLQTTNTTELLLKWLTFSIEQKLININIKINVLLNTLKVIL